MHMLPVFFAARLLVQIIHAWLAGKGRAGTGPSAPA